MTPEEWLALSYEWADALLEIEQASAGVGDRIDAEIARIAREMAKRYVTEFGSIYARNVDEKALAPILAYTALQLRAVKVDYVSGHILDTARKAYAHGWVGAHIGMGKKVPAKPPKIKLSDDVKRAADDAVSTAKDRLNTAALMVERSGRWGELTTSLGKAKQAANQSRGSAAFVTNLAASEAVADVAKGEKNMVRVWVAERDACVHCIAYSGETTFGKRGYPGGLTYGKKPIVPKGEIIQRPPLHWHCRCHEELIRVDDDAIPAALKREARRSVARGFSLPSESEKTRLAAAAKLLDMNPSLPKSVIAYSRRAVKKGSFPKGTRSPVATRGTGQG